MNYRIKEFLGNFMNDYKEFHAFVEGLCETFCFWRANYKPSRKLLKELRSEHHYYMFGRVIGFIGLALFGVWIIKLLWKEIKNA